MLLSTLLPALAGTRAGSGPPDPDIASVAYDSRAVQPRSLFCCVPGLVHDGHDHAAAAVAAGAVALVVERPLALDVPQVVVPDARVAMAAAAAELNDHPSRRIPVVGVTGTNGKTTVVQMVAAIARAAGLEADVIGTLTGERTTPEAPDLQSRLRDDVDAGAALVAMEVSSHALALHRVDSVWFEVGVFTNLSPDHLDFHRTMEDYFRSKATLFDAGRVGLAVVNADDVYGRLLRDATQVEVVTYSMDDVKVLDMTAWGTTFTRRGERVRLPLAGHFNVSNALAAMAVCERLGISDQQVRAGLESMGQVPGRFEVVDVGQRFPVIVDYAHTPDGLRHLLEAASTLRGTRPDGSRGRLAVVFGCGGDRDRAKRPLMGEVAARWGDDVTITSDNPRSEPAMAIIEAILSGVPSGTEPHVEPDRRAAIRSVVGAAQPGDVVVVAGKGHETTQDLGSHVVAFEDRVVAAEELLAVTGP